jgi:hypothetical protein
VDKYWKEEVMTGESEGFLRGCWRPGLWRLEPHGGRTLGSWVQGTWYHRFRRVWVHLGSELCIQKSGIHMGSGESRE